MSDTIRTALEAAAKTYCHLEVRCTCKGPERCFNSAIPKAKTAEAIAAFLRALPIGLPTADKPSPFAFVSEEVKQQWVEAVLAAVKDNQP